MSGVVILGLAALSAWLAINIAIAVAAVILGRRYLVSSRATRQSAQRP
jgi:hypothetical protein